jgi:hypothetical protein
MPYRPQFLYELVFSFDEKRQSEVCLVVRPRIFGASERQLSPIPDVRKF